MTERYLGSGTVADMPTGLTGPVPAHLPDRLAITLWDFSWYTRAGAGDVYADLDAACAEAAGLGYNAIRICAAPLLLFVFLALCTSYTSRRAPFQLHHGLGPWVFRRRRRWNTGIRELRPTLSVSHHPPVRTP